MANWDSVARTVDVEMEGTIDVEVEFFLFFAK